MARVRAPIRAVVRKNSADPEFIRYTVLSYLVDFEVELSFR